MTRSCREFPYYFLLPKDNHWQQDQWCTERFGERWSVVDNRQGVWCTFWRGLRSNNPGGYEWFFENEQDALQFILRWK